MTPPIPTRAPRPVRRRTTAALVFALALGPVAASCSDGPEQTTAGPPGGPEVSTPAGEDSAGPSAGSESTVEPVPAEPIEMPDLEGMSEADARRQLDDLGLAAPVVETRESRQAAGTVLGQVPTAGRVADGTITLILAEAIEPMPDFDGMRLAEVRSWAEERDVDLEVDTSVASGETTGTVLSQIPGAGAEVGSEIRVTVAETPRTVQLSKLDLVDSSYYDVRDIEMDGTTYQATGVITLLGTEPFVSYNLSRDWESVEMTLGLDDFGPADAEVEVKFIGDGQVLHTAVVAFGEVQPVSVDVKDVLRLTVVAAKLEGSRPEVGLGAAQLVGSADAELEDVADGSVADDPLADGTTSG